MVPDETLIALLEKALREEPAVVLREGGVIADGYDAELDELRAIQNNCGEFLLQLEAREKTRTGIANLKVEYNRVHGFYIEVTHAHSEKVPDDYRRRQTLKNAERYITPELKGFRRQGAVRAGSSTGTGKISIRMDCWTCLRRTLTICNRLPEVLPNWMCLRPLPNARSHSITSRRFLLMKQLSKLKRAVIR